MNWMDWSAPDDIEQREVGGKKQIRTPLHSWFGEDDPGRFVKTWEYIGYRQGLMAAKRQERSARLQRLLGLGNQENSKVCMEEKHDATN